MKWVCVDLLLGVAAVCWKAGEPLVMEEVMVAPPLAGEVRIRIICTSLCHSDITFWKLKVRFLCSDYDVLEEDEEGLNVCLLGCGL